MRVNKYVLFISTKMTCFDFLSRAISVFGSFAQCK